MTVPANTTATIFVPTRGGPVLEGGLPAAGAVGVKFLRQESGAAVYVVGSGAYKFQSSVAALTAP